MKGAYRVLGVDAALRCTGLGVVEQQGNRLTAIDFRLVRNKTSVPHSACLHAVQSAVSTYIDRHHPQAAALEGGFYLKNARTAMVLGAVRGVVIAACAAREIPVFEYSPRRAKQAVAGSGAAHKDQVARMIAKLLNLGEVPPGDASDALALAVCHLHSRSGHDLLNPQPI